MTSGSPRTIVITGATRGVGRTTAELFDKKGWIVVGIGRSSADDFPGELVSVDLTDVGATRDTAAAIAAKHHVDVLVNNASHGLRTSFSESHVEDADDLLRVNLHAPVVLSQAFLPAMRERRWGRIINITSLAAVGVPGFTLYGPAKAALDGFTKCLASEVASEGITVNSIALGPVETALFLHHNPEGSATRERWARVIPTVRFGQPEEIAAAVEFFASDLAGYFTGQVLRADGGATLVGAVGASSAAGYTQRGPSGHFADKSG